MNTVQNALNTERLFGLVDFAFAVDPVSTVNALKFTLLQEPLPPLLIFPVHLNDPVHLAALRVTENDVVRDGAQRTFATRLNSAVADLRARMVIPGLSPWTENFDEHVRHEAKFWDEADSRHVLLMIVAHKLVGVVAQDVDSATNRGGNPK